MTGTNSSAVGVFGSHEDAENAVKGLNLSGYDMKKQSVVGKDYQTEEHVVGYYNTGDRMATWGKLVFGSTAGPHSSCLQHPTR